MNLLDSKKASENIVKFQPRIKGIILVIIGAMLWGISGTVAQFLFQKKGFSPEWLVDIRLLVSGLILLLYSFMKGNQDIFKIWKSKHSCWSLIIFSIIGMLGVQYTYFSAIKYGNAATATIIQYLSPVIITCYLIIRSKKIPSTQEMIAIVLAMWGTFFIIKPRSLLARYGSTLVAGWGNSF